MHYIESGFKTTVTNTDFNVQSAFKVLRNHVIPDILGRYETDILYWTGKSLAYKSPLLSLKGAPDFFQQAHFGELKIEQPAKGENALHLDATGLEKHFFNLESRFSAQQKQNIDGFMTESFEEPFGKKNGVCITTKFNNPTIKGKFTYKVNLPQTVDKV
ncbi:MAG TPA: DUF2507 domain-containing protein [Planococcus sp. (in: firmicutes)]|nr:DUF2507 domain-containing protein [Planococcus sp. (in: firmicutes)]